MKRTRLYRDGVLESENFPAADISEYLAESDSVVWLDMCAPNEDDLALIGEELGLHALAVEGAVQEHQRPKLDRYPDHDFLTAYAVRLDVESGSLHTSEMSAFLTPHALVTVRKDEGFDIGEVVRRWDAGGELAGNGVGFLLHGLLDYVVDGHFAAAQDLHEQLEDLEDSVFEDRVNHSAVQRRTLELRKSLVTLRRVVNPMRDLVNALMRDRRLMTESIEPYFQDVYDHVLRAGEWTDSLRELVATVRETQLNIQSQRLNQIMKKLTGWAAIIAVPTAITGFYGQNVPYPGNGTFWGFLVSSGAIVLIGVGLYVLFRRRDWL